MCTFYHADLVGFACFGHAKLALPLTISSEAERLALVAAMENLNGNNDELISGSGSGHSHRHSSIKGQQGTTDYRLSVTRPM